MKKRSWLGLLPLLFLIVSCTSAPAVPEPVAALPASQAQPAAATLVEAEVVPAAASTLAFLVPGSVAEVLVAEGDFVQAGTPLLALFTPELDGAVAQREASLQAAVADLQYWLVPRKHKPPERRWLAEDRVTAAEASLEVARLSQSQNTLLAPYDATVIDLFVAKNETVNAYQAVVHLADLQNLQLETSDLSERVVVNVQIGQAVLVYIEALNTEISGKVAAISTLAGDSGGDVVYTVTIQLDEIPAALRWGMSATVDFESE